ncbi:hypothetical protein COB72_09450 [bacterium]|nr:MAG: hypothetical protein COB72_09450 [bacterium]
MNATIIIISLWCMNTLQLATVAPPITSHRSVPASNRYDATPTLAPTCLFKSGFEKGVTLEPPFTQGGGDWEQHIVGADIPGYSWPMNIWGASGHLQVLVDSSLPVFDYLENRIENTIGHTGKPTRALHMLQYQKAEGWTQDPYIIYNENNEDLQEDSDLYISYWMKYPADLKARLGPDGWFAFMEWKTCCNEDRIAMYVYEDLDESLYWYVQNDNETDDAPNHHIYWDEESRTVPVPVGQWFHVEVFLHRSTGNDGRFLWAIDGQTVVDHHGPNKHTHPFNRFMPFTLYTNAEEIDIWIDDIQIWDAIP